MCFIVEFSCYSLLEVMTSLGFVLIYDGVLNGYDKKGISTITMFNNDVVLKQLIDWVFVKCWLIKVS